MRFAYLVFMVTVLFLGIGNAEEELSMELRMNLNPEKISINENGIYLMTNIFGEIQLSNLQSDDQGHYTICRIAFVCMDCHRKLKYSPNRCDYCGSEKLDFFANETSQKNPLTAQAMLCMMLKDTSFWEEEFWASDGEWHITGKIDDEGNKSISGGIGISNDERTIEIEGTGTIGVDADGNKHVEGQININGKF